MTLLKFLELFKEFIEAVKVFLRLKKIKDLKDAKNSALDEHDQRKLEETLGGGAGPATSDKYPGLYNRGATGKGSSGKKES